MTERESHPVFSILASHRWHDVAYWTLLIVACGVFLVMNVLTTYKEDDLAFTLIDGVWTPVQTFADAVKSYCNHFTNTNGRLSDLVPTLFAGLLGKGAFNVFNTLIFGLLAHLVSLLSTGRRSITALSLFLAVVGTCYPVPGETMLWMAGSANYMWAVTLSLLLVYVLVRRQGTPLGWGSGVLLLLGAIVAGGFNEATSFGFLAGLVLYYAFNRSRLDRWAMVGLVGYLLGVLLIVASPAAWNRAAVGGIVVDMPVGELIKSRLFIFHEKAWRFYVPVAAIAVGVIALIMKRGRAVRQCVWTYVFLCLTLVLLALGMLHERVYAPWATVALIIVAMGLEWPMSRWRWLRVAVLGLSLALAAFTFGRGVSRLSAYKAFDDQVVNEILASPGQAILQERQYTEYSRFIKLMNYRSTDFFAHEIIYRAYYGKDNVQFVNDSIYARYHSGRLLAGARVVPTTTDRPDVLGKALVFPDQDYMVVELKTDTLPATFQTARYLPTALDESLSPEEQQRRREQGINIDYVPEGFYPIQYQGKNYIVCACPQSDIQAIAFPLDISYDPVMATLQLEVNK
ncbi:MAG: hypothetical protein IKW85_10170 [Muribaculaceae bacterium]|nr:hypothetical protein [Muribaculaceae bacterium]